MFACSLVVLTLALADGAAPDAPVVRPVLPAVAPPPSSGGELAPVPGVSLERPAPTRWYGWELMLSDAAFVTLAWRSGWSGGGLMGAAFGVTLGTPLLHIVNGNGPAGVRSIVVRSATWLTAFVALLAGAALDSSGCHSDSCSGGFAPHPTLALAILVAGAAFAVVDDTALATVPAPPDPARRVALTRSFAPARWVPTLSPTPGGVAMGLHGVF